MKIKLAMDAGIRVIMHVLFPAAFIVWIPVNWSLAHNLCIVINVQPTNSMTLNSHSFDAKSLYFNIHKEQPRYNLRSANCLVLKYPSLKLKKTLGDRAFSSAAPNLWNNLPLHIRLEDNFERFKSLLKTHLFRLAFDM